MTRANYKYLAVITIQLIETIALVMAASRRTCVLASCRKVASKTISLFDLPKEENLNAKWTDFIIANGGATRNDKKSWKLCSEHFTEECFSNYRQVIEFNLSSR